MQTQGPVCRHCGPEGVRGYGSTESGIAFVGIAPGIDEWRRTKRPLTGASGQLLDRLLESQGIERDSVYCTNLIHWWNDSPSREEIAQCAPTLREELDEVVKPEIVVLLGKLACETFLGRPFQQARGSVVRQDGRIYMATYHPAACLHKAKTPREKEQQINIAYSLVRDIEKLGDRRRLTTEWAEPLHMVVTNLDEAQQVIYNLVAEGRPIALDIETNYDKEWDQAHPFDSDIVCIGIGNNAAFAYVLALPLREWSRLRWPDSAQYVYHNGSFDTQEIMRHTGVWLPIGDDTMLESYSIDERNPKKGEPGAGLHKLKHLAREFCGASFYEEDDHHLYRPEQLKEATQDILDEQQAKLARMYEYNAKDVVYTWRLHDYLSKRQEPGEKRAYRELLIPGAQVLRESQYYGIHIDQQAMREVSARFITELTRLNHEMRDWSANVLGDPNFNQRSPAQVKKLLELQGFPVPDTRKATLLDLIDQYPDIDFVPGLLRYRTIDKLCGTYIAGINNQIKYDGRVHSHYFLTGTVTGRLSYQLLQTLPKGKTVKDLQVVRSMFAATNDDYVLLEADYAQIEGWIGAWFSEDQVLWAELESGDWHTATTVNMFGKTKDEVSAYEWDALRDAGKHINYGIFFNESAQGLTRRPPTGIGCDLQTAQTYLNKWKAIHHKFVAYQKEQQRLALEEAYIETPFGRRRRFPIIVNDHQLNQAVNCKIQSTAGDYSLSSAIRLKPRLDPLDTHLLLVEHDALYYEVRRQYLQEAIETIREEMQRPPLPSLPSIRIEIDLGPNLAELVKNK